MAVSYKDYYKILGVPRDADTKVVKSAFRKLAKKFHPDSTTGNEEKFKEVNEAYEVLGDAKKRQQYDMLGSHYRHGANFDPPPGWGGPGNGGFGGMGGGHTINLEELLRQQGMAGGGGSGFSSFFDVLFGGGGPMSGMGGVDPTYGHHHHGQPGYGTPQPPQAIEQTLALSLETIANGGEQAVGVNGKRLTVRIPKGVGEGKKIRLAGQGPRGEDIHLMIAYQKHPAFTVEGINLHHQARIPISTLALGGEITIPTLGGNTVNLTVPAGAQGGQRLRLKGQGLPQAKGNNGDLFVTLQAKIPKKLTPEVDALFRELSALGE